MKKTPAIKTNVKNSKARQSTARNATAAVAESNSIEASNSSTSTKPENIFEKIDGFFSGGARTKKSLEEAIFAAQAEVQQYAQEAATLRQQLAAAETARAEAQKDNEIFQVHIADLESAFEIVTTDRTQLTEQVATLRDSLVEAQDRTRAAEDALQAKLEEALNTEQQFIATEDALAQSQLETTNARTELTALQTEMDAVWAEAWQYSTEANAIHAQLIETQNACAEAEKAMQIAQQDAREARFALQQEQAEVTRLSTQLIETQNRAFEAECAINDEVEKEQRLGQQLTELWNSYDSLEKEVEEVIADRNQLIEQVSELSTQLTEARNQAADAQEALESELEWLKATGVYDSLYDDAAATTTEQSAEEYEAEETAEQEFAAEQPANYNYRAAIHSINSSLDKYFEPSTPETQDAYSDLAQPAPAAEQDLEPTFESNLAEKARKA